MGYAIGLGMANIAVYEMNTGQPALLYLVPCTLGILVIYTKYDGTFNEMWEGISNTSNTLNGGGNDEKLDFNMSSGINEDDVHDVDVHDISDHKVASLSTHLQGSSRAVSESGYGGITLVHQEEDSDHITV